MLIIFDCDGVLVDSESLAAQVFSDVLAKIDVYMSAQECFSTFHGKTLAACYEWLANNKNFILEPSFEALIVKETQRYFAEHLNKVDYIDHVLHFLTANNISFCVASNGGHAKILHSLGVTGLDGFFPKEHRFSAQDVDFGKPAPDLFLLAARGMDVAPKDSLVIEDSLTGYQAAVAAGMDVVLYQPHQGDEDSIAEGVKKIRHMSELKKLIESRI